MAHLSVVIPVYENESSLLELHKRLTESLGAISQDFEIILVEDYGKDRSWNIIKELAHSDTRVKGLRLSRNFGQHYAITAGLDVASGDWVVVMDADLQDRPEEIPRLYKKAMEGFEVVLARRGLRKDKRSKRFFSLFFYSIFGYLTGITRDSQVGNFRIISKTVAHNFRRMRENLRFFSGLVDWMGFDTARIDVRHDERTDGKSAYTPDKLLRLALDAIIAYSDKPLRVAVQIGFLMSFFAFLFGGFIVVRALFYGSPVAGWNSLIVSFYFIGGLIIAILGIIGIYLGKTFDETKKRPLYIIKESTAGENSKSVKEYTIDENRENVS